MTNRKKIKQTLENSKLNLLNLFKSMEIKSSDFYYLKIQLDSHLSLYNKLIYDRDILIEKLIKNKNNEESKLTFLDKLFFKYSSKKYILTIKEIDNQIVELKNIDFINLYSRKKIIDSFLEIENDKIKIFLKNDVIYMENQEEINILSNLKNELIYFIEKFDYILFEIENEEELENLNKTPKSNTVNYISSYIIKLKEDLNKLNIDLRILNQKYHNIDTSFLDRTFLDLFLDLVFDNQFINKFSSFNELLLLSEFKKHIREQKDNLNIRFSKIKNELDDKQIKNAKMEDELKGVQNHFN